uniref:ferredoxin--NADP(+) reductase n=1 Tax=Pseudo-nitzschia delicatissima TaxID=44447 RepID=A0A7S0T8C7_9STRA|mmetsp:Transcript_1334/g.3076  ORF Transcript_1334/g.3076 Transcript_1334/m.3076 type:complete len:432 (+) Transcript_1334:136-1431(+)
MRYFNSQSLLAAICACASMNDSMSEAFVVTQSQSQSQSRISSPLYSTPQERVKKAGGGVPVVPSGDRHSFWDPASEGMRGMDGDLSLDERLAFGIEFHLDGDYDLGDHDQQVTFHKVPDLLHAAQCWLEDIDDNPNGVPPAFCTAKKPAEATVLGRTKLIEPDAPGDIQHVVLQLPEGFHYVEGQSLSVIPPGQAANGKPHKPRLYSIASTRYGDLLDGRTVSLCVRRAEYYDPITGVADPAKAGVCSGFLCDVTPGTKVSVAGPVGKTMVLPKDPTKEIIMVATGTGIAPFRSFLHRLYMEHTTARQLFQGNAWLILGVPTTGSLLYKPEFDAMQATTQGQESLTIDYAISREMVNDSGGKLYVQDVLKQKSEELFEKLENGAVIYFCGLKGMMPGILGCLEEIATSKGIDWATTLKKYQSNHQWHVEVY